MSGLSGKWIKFYVKRKHCYVITFHWKTIFQWHWNTPNPQFYLKEKLLFLDNARRDFIPSFFALLFTTYKRRDKLKASLSCTWSPDVVKPAKQRGTHRQLHTGFCKITNCVNLFCNVMQSFVRCSLVNTVTFTFLLIKSNQKRALLNTDQTYPIKCKTPDYQNF